MPYKKTRYWQRAYWWTSSLSYTLVLCFLSACSHRPDHHLSPVEWINRYDKLSLQQEQTKKNNQQNTNHRSIINQVPDSQQSLILGQAIKAWVHWLLGQIDLAQESWQRVLLIKKDVHELTLVNANQNLNNDFQNTQTALCLSALGLLLIDQSKGDRSFDLKERNSLNDLNKLCQNFSPNLKVSHALSALAWSISLTHLSKTQGSEKDEFIRRFMSTYLTQWQKVNQASNTSFSPVVCHLKEQKKSGKSVTEKTSKFYKTYHCKVSCMSRGNTHLLIKKPWSIQSISSSETDKYDSDTEASVLYQGPQFGQVFLMAKEALPVTLPYRIKAGPSEQPSSIQWPEHSYAVIKASLKPDLICAPATPSFSKTLSGLAPKVLIQKWKIMIEQALRMQALQGLSHELYIGLNNAQVDSIWSLMKTSWSQVKLDTDPSFKNDICKHAEVLKQALIQKGNLYKDPLVLQNELKRSLIHCAKTGLDLPKSWFEPKFFQTLFESQAPQFNEPTYWSDEMAWLFADHLLALGASTRAVISPLLARSPNYPLASPWLQAYPEWLPEASTSSIDESRPDLLIKSFQESPWSPLLKGSIGQLLDYQSLYYNAKGQGLRRVLEVIRVNSRKGVEELGELRLPDQAHVIDLYQIKPNGGRRAPLEILETEGYSFSDLQVGDWLVAHYIEAIETERRDESILTPKIMLTDQDRSVWKRVIKLRIDQDKTDVPVDQSIVLRPSIDHVPSSHKVVLNDNHPQRYELNYIVNKSKAYQAEAFGLFDRHRLYLQVGQIHRIKNELNVLAQYLQSYLYASPSVCSDLKTLAPKLDIRSVQALSEWLWTHIQQERPLFESPSVHKALERAAGHRGLVLSAILSACGHSTHLYLARETTAIHDLALSRLDDFPYFLIKVNDQWLDPQLPNIPVGLVHPQYAGGAAIRIWPVQEKGAPYLELIPTWSMLTSRYKQLDHDQIPLSYQLEGELHREWSAPTGVLGTKSFKGKMQHRFYGADGAILFDKMSRATPTALKAWVEKQWSQWLGRAEVRQLKFNYDQQVLKLNYVLRVWLRSGQSLSINPQQWGRRFASLKDRQSALYLSPIHQVVKLKLNDIALHDSSSNQLKRVPLVFKSKYTKSLNPFLWLSQPSAQGLEQVKASFRLNIQDIEPLEYERPHTQLGQKKRVSKGVELKAEWTLSGGVIEKKQYSAWKKFASEVDQNEQIVIKLE